MKKIILTFIVATLFISVNYAQRSELADNHTLFVSGTRAQLNRASLVYQPLTVTTLPNTGVQIWTFLFPFNAAGATFTNIIKVSDHIRSNTEVSSDPNYFTEIGNFPDNDVDCNLGLLPKCKYPLDIQLCENKIRNPVLVAIVDCGIAGDYGQCRRGSMAFNTFHTWFSGKIWRNTENCDAFDNDRNGYVDDFTGWNWTSENPNGDYLNIDKNSHGSHVNGIVAQIVNNVEGQQVQLMNLKTQNGNGHGSLLSLMWAIDYAVGKKVKIMNLSLSYKDEKLGCDDSALKAIIDSAGKKCDMLFVVAAGNNRSDLDDKSAYSYFPAHFKNRNMIVVGASTCDGERLEFSNIGITSVDIAAPGEHVLSSVLGESCGYKSGTSMATPFVTATAALLGTQMRWNSQEIKNIILQNAIPNDSWIKGSVSRGNLDIQAALKCKKRGAILIKEPNITLATNTLGVSPNPFSDMVQIKVGSEMEEDVILSIQNTFGQVILSQKMHFQKGENLFEWQSSQLQKGIYIVKVQWSNQILTQKILKQ